MIDGDVSQISSTTRAALVERLREDILNGRVPAGTHLRQVEIATRFGVSTTPVREAFRELATLGLVEIHAHRGAVVLAPSATELAQIYEVRTIVEPICAAWAAELITEAEVQAARALLEASRDGGMRDAAGLNRRFHAVIVGACGNSHLAELTLNLLDRSTPYIVRVLRSSPERLLRQAEEHAELLAACEARDPARAYRASRDHLAHLYDDIDVAAAPSTAMRWLPFEPGGPR
jgi:DNA-binding GntR family transcriptional regulator